VANKTALITGISGQDGSYLAELLVLRGYEVFGLTRDPVARFGPNLAHLEGKIKLLHTAYDIASLIDILNGCKPEEVYNCAGQTFVGKSWEMLDETLQASGVLACNMLEAIIRVDKRIRFFQASSCEIFSLKCGGVYTEETPISPGNPYGCSKAYAHSMVACYRENYGIHAVNGILFHHESPRRHDSFVSRKVVKRAVAIKLGKEKALALGNMDVVRDWSFAPDVVVAIAEMVRMKEPQDLVICSGQAHALRELVEKVFALLGMEYTQYVRFDTSLRRVSDAAVIRGSNEKARKALGWAPKTTFHQMLEKMVDYEMRLQTGVEQNFSGERPFA
jgi:GDPmannose 4,6-dehydratase